MVQPCSQTATWESRVEPQTFRQVMASFPTGLTVISASDGAGRPVGFTANAITSVSLEPPILLACLSHSLFTLSIIEQTRTFAVNFLESGQADVAQRFATSAGDKFQGIAYQNSARGLPLIDGALAYAECEVIDLIEAGDHTIALGLVVEGNAVSGQPLMFFKGQFASWPQNGNGSQAPNTT